MKFFSLASGLLLLATLAGCAKSPAGGVTNTAPNRLEVTLTLAQTIDPNFYYAVAFDDNPNDGDGPRAIVGNTAVLNGVMAGNWRTLVRYHLNQFEVFYRSNPADPSTERQILGTALFFSQPRATANSLNFVLDLDAQVSQGNFFFAHTSGATPALAVDRFDVNFVATNTIIIAGRDDRIKPVDAYEAGSTSTFFEFQIGSTRRATIQDPTGDRRLDIDPSFGSVNFGQIDVTQLDLNVTRNR
ncbi:MAG: hypothetical protein KY445_10380 [Armatimonadetes bacterium]|nr:hypothetical protein [Armatimonadota bacterium]